MEAWRLKMEPRRVCRPLVANLQHLDEEQDPDQQWRKKSDPDPHKSEKMDLDPHLSDADPQPRLKLSLFT